jgi:hypothetical protein
VALQLQVEVGSSPPGRRRRGVAVVPGFYTCWHSRQKASTSSREGKMERDAREAAALAARAAARAKLAAAGQLLPTAGAGALVPPPSRHFLEGLDPARKLLAARAAFGESGGGGGGGGGGAVPVGWAVAEDGSGRRYYYSRELGRSQWVRPADAAGGPPLPAGWFEAEAGGGARYFFTAAFTNVAGAVGSLVTWERPTAPPLTA